MKKKMIVLKKGKSVKDVASDGNCCTSGPTASK